MSLSLNSAQQAMRDVQSTFGGVRPNMEDTTAQVWRFQLEDAGVTDENCGEIVQRFCLRAVSDRRWPAIIDMVTWIKQNGVARQQHYRPSWETTCAFCGDTGWMTVVVPRNLRTSGYVLNFGVAVSEKFRPPEPYRTGPVASCVMACICTAGKQQEKEGHAAGETELRAKMLAWFTTERRTAGDGTEYIPNPARLCNEYERACFVAQSEGEPSTPAAEVIDETQILF